jgi:hypothetical protein
MWKNGITEYTVISRTLYCGLSLIAALPFSSRDSAVSIATGLRAGVRIPAGQGLFLFSKMSSLAPGLTHPPDQWALKSLVPGRAVGHPSHSNTGVKNECLFGVSRDSFTFFICSLRNEVLH